MFAERDGLYGGSYKLSVFDVTGDTTGEGKATALGGEISRASA